MRYRRFGRTGWQVSEIGYGVWGMGGWSSSDDQQSLESLQAAVNHGCNFYDTAYAHGEGRGEIYIRSFPQAGSKLQVSSSGGNQPVWSRDGRTLFFRGSGTVQEIAFEAGARLSVSKARSLFADRFESPQAGGHTGYDIFPDGRFLMIQSQAQPSTGEEIVVVFNWIEELKREVPGAGR